MPGCASLDGGGTRSPRSVLAVWRCLLNACRCPELRDAAFTLQGSSSGEELWTRRQKKATPGPLLTGAAPSEGARGHFLLMAKEFMKSGETPGEPKPLCQEEVLAEDSVLCGIKHYQVISCLRHRRPTGCPG